MYTLSECAIAMRSLIQIISKKLNLVN